MKTFRTTFWIAVIIGMAASIPANAATYTLAQLIAGEDFTIGTAQFTGWTLDTNDTSADPSQITVDTIDDPGFPGFQINGNNELVGDEATLVYTFTVVTTNLRAVIAGGFLDLSDFNATSEGEITINLLETSEASGLELAVFVNNGNDTQLQDAGGLEALVNTMVIESNVKLDLGRDAGTVAVNNYRTQIVLLSGSDKPELTNLTISEGTLSPTFAGDTREYDATVPFDTTSVSVTATAEAGSTLTLNGAPITSGVASPPQNLSVGANEFTILLTAADATESSYTIVVSRQSENAPTVEFTGSNATGIRNLMVGGVLYDVEFVQGTAEAVYGAYPGVYDFPTLDREGGPAADAVNAILAVLATEPAVVTVGPANSPTFNVGFGNFIYPVDGVDQEWVNVTQGYYFGEWLITGNPDSYAYQQVLSFADFTAVDTGPLPVLTGLTISEGTLTPTFNSETRNYMATVPFEITSISVTATADAGTTLTLNEQAITSGEASPSQVLNVGGNELVIQVSAAGSQSSYSVVVTREPDAAAPVLTDLTISEGTLTPTFDSNTSDYTATVPFETTSMSVTATADAGTTLTLNGVSITSGVASPPQNLSMGANELVIALSDGGTDSSYRVVVTRAEEEVGATVEFTGSNATGIRNLNVAGVLYNVEFVEAAAETVYGAYPGVFDFPTTIHMAGPAAEAVSEILTALATEPAVTTVGPANSLLFQVGFGSFTTPIMEVDTEWVNVTQGYYLDGWTAPENPDTVGYQVPTTYADFTEVGAEPDAPVLDIAQSNPNEVTISWSPATAGFVLQERAEVDSGNWTDSPSGSTNPIIIPSTEDAKFYRVFSP